MTSGKNVQSLLDIVKGYASSEKLTLPVFPSVANQLQQVMADTEVSIDQIADIISRDQSLASQILKMANSAFFSGLNRVRTIREALLRMGINQVFNCLIVTAQKDLYKSKNDVIDGYLVTLWRHALATAMGTKWLLKKTGYSELAEEGFLAGLLHDIGKLLLLRVIEHLNSENEELKFSTEFITEILESMHVEQGCNLMEEWSIPPVYCTIARDHHIEDFDSSDVQLLAVRITNQLCHKLSISMHPETAIVPATLPEVHALGIREIVLAELEIVLEDAMETDLAAR